MKFNSMTTVNQARDLWPEWIRGLEAQEQRMLDEHAGESEFSPEAAAAGEQYLGYHVPVDPAELTICEGCE